jgi:hypothetical protein
MDKRSWGPNIGSIKNHFCKGYWRKYEGSLGTGIMKFRGAKWRLDIEDV